MTTKQRASQSTTRRAIPARTDSRRSSATHTLIAGSRRFQYRTARFRYGSSIAARIPIGHRVAPLHTRVHCPGIDWACVAGVFDSYTLHAREIVVFQASENIRV